MAANGAHTCRLERPTVADFGPDWYDEEYFVGAGGGKAFLRPDGTLGRWSYYNPTGEWLGCGPVVGAWLAIFRPRTLLDVGCGRSTFVAYARRAGIEAYGFDFSTWAIEHHYPGSRPGWLQVADARAVPFRDRAFDLVVALDLLEHIYAEDVPTVLAEIFRVSRAYVFFEVATVGSGPGPEGMRHEEGYMLRRGQPIPPELEGCAVAGHVTVQPRDWWEERMMDADPAAEWVFRRDLEQQFRALVPPEVIRNWNTIIVLSREA